MGCIKALKGLYKAPSDAKNTAVINEMTKASNVLKSVFEKAFQKVTLVICAHTSFNVEDSDGII
jgi:hypothetical protein